MSDNEAWEQRIRDAEGADEHNPAPRWIICARSMMTAYGVFPSEAAAWKFARERGMDPRLIDSVPLGYPTEGRVDKESFMRQPERPKSADC